MSLRFEGDCEVERLAAMDSREVADDEGLLDDGDAYLDDADTDEDYYDDEDDYDDGQPSEYEEWQDLYGGDDWDNGQYDMDNY